MSRRPITAALLAGLLACVGAPALATSASAAPALHARTSGTLSYAPHTFVGGQAMTFTGRLGVSGRRHISLQQYMGRPGDIWFPVAGSSAYTASNGTFRIHTIAPDMWNIRYRVVAAGLATPSVLLKAKVQGVDLWVAGADPKDRDQRVTPQAGVPFTVTADASPDIPGRTYVLGTPVFTGRVLTLQKRITGSRWLTLGTTRELSDGFGSFPGIVENAPGTVVYRVREERVVTGGNRIGWVGSYPTYLTVDGSGTPQQPPAPTTTMYDAWQPVAASGSTVPSSMKQASSAYGWGSKVFDFDWEDGKSLTDPPKKGTGTWLDYSDGSGRASKHNGMLALDSRREDAPGTGDVGTTMAILRGSPHTYGRWEARMFLRSPETTGRDYDLRMELVPALASQYACGSRNILLGQYRAHSSTLTFGVKNGSRSWSATRSVGTLLYSSPAVAVEVEPTHITWFFAGHVIGTVRQSAALSRVPMTLRWSLVGHGTDEMNRTLAGSDWQRAYAPGTGRQVTSGPSLRYGAQPQRCDS